MTPTEPLKDASAVVDLMKRLENEKRLDALVGKVAPVVERVLASPQARDALQGRWLGHAVHPLLTDFPLAMWTCTNVLDLLPVPGSRRSAERLLALGIVSAPIVFLTGWAEWREVEPREKRVGVVHAVLNGSGMAMYGLSLAARRRDRHGLGVVLALGGSALAAGAGYLGGHLTAVRKVSSYDPAFDNPTDNPADAPADIPVDDPAPASTSVATPGFNSTDAGNPAPEVPSAKTRGGV